MLTTYRALALVGPLLLAACGRSAPDRDARRESAAAAAPLSDAAGLQRASCEPRPGGVRVTADSVAGIPARVNLRQLRQLCPRARQEKSADSHDENLAMRVDFPGAVARATFAADPDDPPDEAPLVGWLVGGDSVRFPDGALVPRTIGALRQLDSAGSMIESDVEDEPELTFVALCRYPELLVEVGGGVRRPTTGSPWPLRSVAADDTARVVELVMTVDRKDRDWERAGCR